MESKENGTYALKKHNIHCIETSGNPNQFYPHYNFELDPTLRMNQTSLACILESGITLVHP